MGQRAATALARARDVATGDDATGAATGDDATGDVADAPTGAATGDVA
jgi:hypothetical protein